MIWFRRGDNFKISEKGKKSVKSDVIYVNF